MTAKKKLLHIMDLSYIEKYHLNSSFLNKKIVIYNDRFSHIDKHKLEFSSIDEYNNAVNNIETIIKDPDFISIESGGRSIQFIKTLKDQDGIITEFDDVLWGSMVELVTIGREKRSVTFKDGTEITVE